MIRSIAGHPKVYRYLHDDDAPPADEWQPVIHPQVSWMIVYWSDVPIGLFIVSAHSLHLWELHVAFLPEFRGQIALAAGKQFLAWIWRESKCLRLFGQIVATNRSSLKFAKAAGLTEFGVHPRSFMKNGKMQDQVLVGLDRPQNF